MPGSDGSNDADGDLVNVAARPTIDGQLVDVANAAIEKIRRKAAVAQGSWMKWFTPAGSESAEGQPEKPEASARSRERVQAVVHEVAAKLSVTAAAPREHIPTGPALQTSSSSPGNIVSSSSAFTSPHGSSRCSSSVKCQSPEDCSPPLEPQEWENQEDDHNLAHAALERDESASSGEPNCRRQAWHDDDDERATRGVEGAEHKGLPPDTKLSEKAEAVVAAGRNMAEMLRGTVQRVAERERAARLPLARERSTAGEGPPEQLETGPSLKPRSPSGADTEQASERSEVLAPPGPLVVLGGVAVAVPTRGREDRKDDSSHEGSRLSLRDWLGSVARPRGGATELALCTTLESEKAEDGEEADGYAHAQGPQGPGSTGSARTPSPHAAPSGAAWASTLDINVEELMGPVRERLQRRMEKVMRVVTPHVDAVKDALGMTGGSGPAGETGRCFRTVVTQMGHSYQGQFKDGLMDGYGRLEWPDGHWYQGEFRGGETHGVGRRVWGGGLEFVGEEVNGRKAGVGVMTWPDGRRYEGEFAGDVKDGVGLMVWAGGEWYLGGWKGGVKHGDGLEGGPGVGVVEVRYEAGRCVWGEAAEGLESEEWEVAEWMKALLWFARDPPTTSGAATPVSSRSGGAEETPKRTRRRGEERKIARQAITPTRKEAKAGGNDGATEKHEGDQGKKGERVRCVLQVVNGEIWSIPQGLESKGLEGGEEEAEERQASGARRSESCSADMPREAGEEEGEMGDFAEEGDCPPSAGVRMGGEVVVEGSWDEGGDGERGAPRLEHSISSESVLSSSSSTSDERSPPRGGSWTEGSGRVRLRDRMLEMFQGSSLTEMVEEDKAGEATWEMGLAERLVAKSHRAVRPPAKAGASPPPVSPSSAMPALWDRPVPTPPASSPPALPTQAGWPKQRAPAPVPVHDGGVSPADRELWAAAGEGDAEGLAAALDKGGRVSMGDEGDRGNTALHKAASAGRLLAVRTLLAWGAHVLARNRFGDSALHCAAYAGHEEVVGELLAEGADLNASSEDGETPMHCAAYGGHAGVCALLAAKGASVNVASGGDGDTALHMAAIGGHEETVAALLAAGADPLVANREGQMARDLAELQGWHSVAAALHEAALPDCSL